MDDSIITPRQKEILKESFNFKFFSPLRVIESSEDLKKIASTMSSEITGVKHSKKKKRKSKLEASENVSPIEEIMSPSEEIPHDGSGSGKKKKSKHSKSPVIAMAPVHSSEAAVLTPSPKKDRLKLKKKKEKATANSNSVFSGDLSYSPERALTSPPSKKRKSSAISPGPAGDGPSSSKPKKSKQKLSLGASASEGGLSKSPASKNAAAHHSKSIVQPVVLTMTSDSSSDSSSDEEAPTTPLPRTVSSQKVTSGMTEPSGQAAGSISGKKFKTADIIARVAADIMRARSSGSGSDSTLASPTHVKEKAAFPASPLVNVSSPTKKSKLSLKDKSPTKAKAKLLVTNQVTPARPTGPMAGVSPRPGGHLSESDSSADSEDEVVDGKPSPMKVSQNPRPSVASSESDIFADSFNRSGVSPVTPTVKDSSSSESDSSDEDVAVVQPKAAMPGAAGSGEESSSESSSEEENPVPVHLVSPKRNTSQSAKPKTPRQSKKTPENSPAGTTTQAVTNFTTPARVNSSRAQHLRYEHPGFTELPSTATSGLCKEDLRGKALWLVSLPPDFDPVRLNGKPIIMNGTLQMEKDKAEAANWELLSSKLVPTIPGLTALLPSRQDGKLHPAGIVESHISIVKTVLTPPCLVPNQTKQQPTIPDSLKHRNKPFGSGEPIINHSLDGVKKAGKKKKRKNSENLVMDISNVSESPEPITKKVKKKKKKKHQDSMIAANNEPLLPEPMEMEPSAVSEQHETVEVSVKKVKKSKKKQKSEDSEDIEMEPARVDPLPSEEVPEETQGGTKKKKKKKKHKEQGHD